MSDLDDDDWIVHLDEETILSDGSVKGIVDFVCEGRHQFGQGVITYANEKVRIIVRRYDCKFNLDFLMFFFYFRL